MNGVIFINIDEYANLDDEINVNTKQYKDIMYLYSKALKSMEQKINIIKYDYEYQNEYNTIDHVMLRIKSPESILKKMKNDGIECTYLEHKIKYKPNGEINENISRELVKCARDINRLDNKMVKLFHK